MHPIIRLRHASVCARYRRSQTCNRHRQRHRPDCKAAGLPTRQAMQWGPGPRTHTADAAVETTQGLGTADAAAAAPRCQHRQPATRTSTPLPTRQALLCWAQPTHAPATHATLPACMRRPPLRVWRRRGAPVSAPAAGGRHTRELARHRQTQTGYVTDTDRGPTSDGCHPFTHLRRRHRLRHRGCAVRQASWRAAGASVSPFWRCRQILAVNGKIAIAWRRPPPNVLAAKPAGHKVPPPGRRQRRRSSPPAAQLLFSLYLSKIDLLF